MLPDLASSPARLFGKRRDPATALASPEQQVKAARDPEDAPAARRTTPSRLLSAVGRAAASLAGVVGSALAGSPLPVAPALQPARSPMAVEAVPVALNAAALRQQAKLDAFRCRCARLAEQLGRGDEV
mmetsp:Transcript_8045/g.16148  ORF Transcript_8045/g.16148 Transcript_8045/m.16148 type:complete len:128 (+) Transcript_8045:157-540(+)